MSATVVITRRYRQAALVVVRVVSLVQSFNVCDVLHVERYGTRVISRERDITVSREDARLSYVVVTATVLSRNVIAKSPLSSFELCLSFDGSDAFHVKTRAFRTVSREDTSLCPLRLLSRNVIVNLFSSSFELCLSFDGSDAFYVKSRAFRTASREDARCRFGGAQSGGGGGGGVDQ